MFVAFQSGEWCEERQEHSGIHINDTRALFHVTNLIVSFHLLQDSLGFSNGNFDKCYHGEIARSIY